jgi:hypothetical protein
MQACILDHNEGAQACARLTAHPRLQLNAHVLASETSCCCMAVPEPGLSPANVALSRWLSDRFVGNMVVSQCAL